MAKFKHEVLQRMGSDPDLFAALLKALEVKPSSLPVLINRNGRTINQYSIVKLVADYLNVEPDSIVEEESETLEQK